MITHSNNNSELTALLYKIIEREIAKPENEADLLFIEKCADLIENLSEEKCVYSKEELEIKYQELIGIEKENEDFSEQNRFIVAKRRKPNFKRIITIAAAVIIFASILTTIFMLAKQNGSQTIPTTNSNNSSEHIISSNFSPPRDVDFYEKYDVLYPRILPFDIQINDVIEIDEESGELTIIFNTTDEALKITVRSYYITEIDSLIDATLYQTEYLDFYIVSLENDTFSAIGQYNGYEYNIIYNDYDDLLNILDNMK